MKGILGKFQLCWLPVSLETYNIHLCERFIVRTVLLRKCDFLRLVSQQNLHSIIKVYGSKRDNLCLRDSNQDNRRNGHANPESIRNQISSPSEVIAVSWQGLCSTNKFGKEFRIKLLVTSMANPSLNKRLDAIGHRKPQHRKSFQDHSPSKKHKFMF